MLFIVPGLLLVLAARPLARWAEESGNVLAGETSATVTSARMSVAYLWGYRVLGMLVVLIGVVAESFPLTVGQ